MSKQIETESQGESPYFKDVEVKSKEKSGKQDEHDRLLPIMEEVQQDRSSLRICPDPKWDIFRRLKSRLRSDQERPDWEDLPGEY